MRRLWFWIVGWAGTNRLSRWLHPRLYRWTGGAWLVGRSLGNLTVLLTTTGRRSGAPRPVAIWAYRDDEALILVGSYGGSRRTPAWVLNLRARPEATVQVRREVRTVRSREAGGEEYHRLWSMVVAAYPGYEAYLAWAHRAIPLVVLEAAPALPAAPAAGKERLVVTP
jgi:deazaflavin-dependent oxidoreductase (nitroreductase family)